MKYVHTNLISSDWQTLAGFYIQVFNCKLILPKRDLSGDWLAKGTAVKNAHIKGAHLRLPGYGKNGPTLEIFQYTNMEDQNTPLSNRKGFGHIAFEVNDVQKTLDKALELGGKSYGEIATKNIPDVGLLTFVYIKDPEGNIIELQNWGKAVAVIEPKEEEAEQKLPTDQDQTLEVKGDSTPVKVKEEKGIVKVKEEGIDLSEENKFSDKVGNDSLKTKRELLDELQNDLNASKRDIENAKNSIKDSKKDSIKQLEKDIADIHKQKEEEARQKAAHKAALLADLKKEMGLSEDNKIALNTDPENKNTDKEKPLNQATQKVILPQSKVPPQLNVEIKIGNAITKLDLSKIKLSQTPDLIAKDLRSITTLPRPDDYDKLFIEWICADYKADLVPLLKQYKSEHSAAKKEEAWAILPRLRDSLKHLLGKCETDPEILLTQRLDSLEMSTDDFVSAYNNLLTIVLAAEKQGATHLRVCYSTIEAN